MLNVRVIIATNESVGRISKNGLEMGFGTELSCF